MIVRYTVVEHELDGTTGTIVRCKMHIDEIVPPPWNNFFFTTTCADAVNYPVGAEVSLEIRNAGWVK